MTDRVRLCGGHLDGKYVEWGKSKRMMFPIIIPGQRLGIRDITELWNTAWDPNGPRPLFGVETYELQHRLKMRAAVTPWLLPKRKER